jgi:polyferredoxin
VLRLVSWFAFIGIAFYLLRKRKMNQKNALILTGLSVIVNGLIFGLNGAIPNPVQPIQSLSGGDINPAFIVILVILLGTSLLFGRLFCGYACPVGSFQEFLWRIRSKIAKKKWIIKIPASIAQGVRVAVFLTMILLAAVIVPAIQLFQLINPFHFFTFNTSSPYGFLSTTFWISVGIFGVSLFIYRPFCRLLCPFGLLANLTTRFMPTKLLRGTECTNCKLCERECPTGTYIDAKTHGECYLCGRCSEKCPKDVLFYQIKKNDQNPKDKPQ